MMDTTGLLMLGVAVLIAFAVSLWWPARSRTIKPPIKSVEPGAGREKRRGPRRVKNSRRESFRMGKDDNERRSGDDRRPRQPGWDDRMGKR